MATPFSYAKIANNGGGKVISSRIDLDKTLLKNITVENA